MRVILVFRIMTVPIFDSLKRSVSLLNKAIFETVEYNYILFFLQTRFVSRIPSTRQILRICERYDRVSLLELNTFPEDVTCKGRRYFDTNLSNQEGARWNTKVARATKCWNSRGGRYVGAM